MELTTKQLKEKLQSNEKFILDLYASWCGPCKVLSPILERVSNKLKESNSDVSVYKFNIEHDSELVSLLGVRAVPTLKFYSGGENKRTETGMMSEQALIEAAQVL
jgi:thioredoxin 1